VSPPVGLAGILTEVPSRHSFPDGVFLAVLRIALKDVKNVSETLIFLLEIMVLTFREATY
jgi:hypothetical protein